MRLAFLSCSLFCAACAGNPGVGRGGNPLDLGLAVRDAAPGADLAQGADLGAIPEDTGTVVPDAGSAPGVDLGTPDLGAPDLGTPDLGAPDLGGMTGGATPTAAGQIVITEIMYDPAAVTDANGEYFELYNPSATMAYDLSGCVIDDSHYPATSAPIATSIVVSPGGYVTLADSSSPGFTPTYSYAGAFALNNSGGDSVVLDCGGSVIARVDYGTGWPAATGASLQLSSATLDGPRSTMAANWCLSTAAISGSDGDLGTPGHANRACP